MGKKLFRVIPLQNRTNNRILVPRLAINGNFSRYSPGIILINETVKYIKNEMNNVNVFDLSKGAEQYKFVMGGSEYLHYDFILSENLI